MPAISQSPESGPTQASTTATDQQPVEKVQNRQGINYKPFSQIALGGGFSTMGVNLQVATNVSRNLNLRGTGNVFRYSVNNVSTNGYNINGTLNLATAGVALDYYPFAKHGLRLSPGILLYNQNSLAASVAVQGGSSFKLNGNTYYSSSSNPVMGTMNAGLNNLNPAFTLTTGWGNMISRKGSRISFPFEIGAAFVGSPTLNMSIAQGQVCNSSGGSCQNASTNATLQSDLAAQVASNKNDISLLKIYPIVSFGISYRFGIR